MKSKFCEHKNFSHFPKDKVRTKLLTSLQKMMHIQLIKESKCFNFFDQVKKSKQNKQQNQKKKELEKSKKNLMTRLDSFCRETKSKIRSALVFLEIWKSLI